MKVLFAACAQSATVDRTTNRVSLFNVIDHYPTPVFPIVLPTIAFVAVIERDDGEDDASGTTEICVPDAAPFTHPVSIVFTGSRLSRVILNVQGIPMQREGLIRFRLILADGSFGEASFLVTNVAPTQNSAPEAAEAHQ
jgi:hypothetical protein